MNRRAGSILRRTGLLLEVLGIIGIYSQRGEKAANVTVPWVGSVSPAWCALMTGFVLWVAGTILYFRAGQRQNLDSP